MADIIDPEFLLTRDVHQLAIHCHWSDPYFLY